MYLYCSGCALGHPACLFTPEQRAKTTSSGRICIGHEGHIRLCEHRASSWKWLAARARRAEKGGKIPTYPSIFRCTRGSHLHLCEKWQRAPNLNQRRKMPRETPSRIRQRHPTLDVRWSQDHGGVLITRSWSAHMVLTNPSGSPLPPAALAARLAELGQQEGRFVCPATEPGTCHRVFLDGSLLEIINTRTGYWREAGALPCPGGGECLEVTFQSQVAFGGERGRLTKMNSN